MCNLTNECISTYWNPLETLFLSLKKHEVYRVQELGVTFGTDPIPTMNYGPAARVPPGSLLEMQTIRPALDHGVKTCMFTSSCSHPPVIYVHINIYKALIYSSQLLEFYCWGTWRNGGIICQKFTQLVSTRTRASAPVFRHLEQDSFGAFSLPLQRVVFLAPQLIFLAFISECILGLRATWKVNETSSLSKAQHSWVR